MTEKTKEGWSWWAGDNEEWMSVGPFDTRQEAIDAAVDEGVGEFLEGGEWYHAFFVQEAEQKPLRLADWIGTDRLIERAEDELADSDRVSLEYDGGPWFEVTTEQEADLVARIEAACDSWQRDHNLVFMTGTFGDVRNQESIVVPARKGGDHDED